MQLQPQQQKEEGAGAVLERKGEEEMEEEQQTGKLQDNMEHEQPKQKPSSFPKPRPQSCNISLAINDTAELDEGDYCGIRMTASSPQMASPAFASSEDRLRFIPDSSSLQNSLNVILTRGLSASAEDFSSIDEEREHDAKGTEHYENDLSFISEPAPFHRSDSATLEEGDTLVFSLTQTDDSAKERDALEESRIETHDETTLERVRGNHSLQLPSSGAEDTLMPEGVLKSFTAMPMITISTGVTPKAAKEPVYSQPWDKSNLSRQIESLSRQTSLCSVADVEEISQQSFLCPADNADLISRRASHFSRGSTDLLFRQPARPSSDTIPLPRRPSSGITTPQFSRQNFSNADNSYLDPQTTGFQVNEDSFSQEKERFVSSNPSDPLYMLKTCSACMKPAPNLIVMQCFHLICQSCIVLSRHERVTCRVCCSEQAKPATDAGITHLVEMFPGLFSRPEPTLTTQMSLDSQNKPLPAEASEFATATASVVSSKTGKALDSSSPNVSTEGTGVVLVDALADAETQKKSGLVSSQEVHQLHQLPPSNSEDQSAELEDQNVENSQAAEQTNDAAPDSMLLAYKLEECAIKPEGEATFTDYENVPRNVRENARTIGKDEYEDCCSQSPPVLFAPSSGDLETENAQNDSGSFDNTDEQTASAPEDSVASIHTRCGACQETGLTPHVCVTCGGIPLCENCRSAHLNLLVTRCHVVVTLTSEDSLTPVHILGHHQPLCAHHGQDLALQVCFLDDNDSR
jgi:hypothetical protein